MRRDEQGAIGFPFLRPNMPDMSDKYATRGPIFTRVSIVLLVLALSVLTIRQWLEYKRGSPKTLQDLLMWCTAVSVLGSLCSLCR